MRPQWRRWSVACLVAAGLVGTSSACKPPVFPAELFTLRADGADYPVMLSQTPPGGSGRKIQAASGTQASATTASYMTGDATVTVTSVQQGQSELPASAQLHAQVMRADKWLQIDQLQLYSMDFSTYGAGRAVRSCTIDGTVYR